MYIVQDWCPLPDYKEDKWSIIYFFI
jgi:hypothetical protein